MLSSIGRNPPDRERQRGSLPCEERRWYPTNTRRRNSFREARPRCVRWIDWLPEHPCKPSGRRAHTASAACSAPDAYTRRRRCWFILCSRLAASLAVNSRPSASSFKSLRRMGFRRSENSVIGSIAGISGGGVVPVELVVNLQCSCRRGFHVTAKFANETVWEKRTKVPFRSSLVRLLAGTDSARGFDDCARSRII